MQGTTAQEPRLPLNVVRYGLDEPLPEQRILRAGRLSLVFEGGDLRYVRLDEREIVRRVYVAIRDANWNTVPGRISALRIDEHEDRFDISYRCEHVQGPIDFVWTATISGRSDGTITFAMHGEARSTFLRNRIGICVLYPPRECAGARYRVEKADGSTEEGTLPKAIAPHQPVMDIRTLSHEVLPGLWAEMRFAGDVFEMEDQRNWTDASFKVYSTPLRLPFPVEVPRGTVVEQSVTLRLDGALPERRVASDDLRLTLADATAGPLPRLGLGSASHGRSLSQREIERLRALRLTHLRLDLDLSEAAWQQVLQQGAEEARALGVGIELALLLGDNAEQQLRALRDALGALRPRVAAWLVLHRSEHAKQATSKRWLELARSVLTDYAREAPFGAGTNANFTELNRVRPPVDAADLVFFPITPQVHAFDNASLVENLEAQRSVVESARLFCGHLPLAVTPVTLRQRFNPVATGPETEPPPGELPPQVDPRQMSLFGAAWTLGSLKQLAESGVASVTYFETTGWRGVMETSDGSPLPGRFRSLPGTVFPVYHVLADVGELAGGEVIPVTSSAPLKLEGLALQQGQRQRVLLANLSAQTIRARVGPLGGGAALVRVLDERSAQRAMVDPEGFRAEAGELRSTVRGDLEVELLPYAVARIDVQPAP